MSVLNKLEHIFRNLEGELKLLASELDGTVKEGVCRYTDKCADMPKVEYPSLEGMCGEVKVFVNFAVIADTKMAIAGRAVNRASHDLDDFLQPWLQVYAYGKSPFRLWVSPEKAPGKKGLMARLAMKIGMSPVEIEVGIPSLDDNYFFDCRSNQQAAAVYLKQSDVKGLLDSLRDFYVLRFDDAYLKLIRGDQDPASYNARTLLPWIRTVAALAEKLPE